MRAATLRTRLTLIREGTPPRHGDVLVESTTPPPDSPVRAVGQPMGSLETRIASTCPVNPATMRWRLPVEHIPRGATPPYLGPPSGLTRGSTSHDLCHDATETETPWRVGRLVALAASTLTSPGLHATPTSDPHTGADGTVTRAPLPSRADDIADGAIRPPDDAEVEGEDQEAECRRDRPRPRLPRLPSREGSPDASSGPDEALLFG